MAIITETPIDAEGYETTIYSITDGDSFVGTIDEDFDQDWIEITNLQQDTVYNFTLATSYPYTGPQVNFAVVAVLPDGTVVNIVHETPIRYSTHEGEFTREIRAELNITNVLKDYPDAQLYFMVERRYHGEPITLDYTVTIESIGTIYELGAEDTQLVAGSGGDLIVASNGNHVIYGGDGDDQVNINEGYAGGPDTVYGGMGDDTIEGLSDFSMLFFGEEGHDILVSGSGDDTLDGGIGNDILNPAQGNNVVYAGEGNDTYRGSNASNDLVYGGSGDDELLPYQGNDTIYGGEGNDTISQIGLSGDSEPSHDYFDGGSGDDIIYIEHGYATLVGGTGNDYLRSSGNNPWSVEIYGGEGDDSLYGGMNHDVLSGGPGRDRFSAGNGNDTVLGGSGSDTIYGSRGHDYEFGGTGDDYFLNFGGDDTMIGGLGNDTFNWASGDGNDVFNENSPVDYAWVPGMEPNPANDVDTLILEGVNRNDVVIGATYEETVLPNGNNGYSMTHVTLTISTTGEVLSFVVNKLTNSTDGYSDEALWQLTGFEVFEFEDQVLRITEILADSKSFPAVISDEFEFLPTQENSPIAEPCSFENSYTNSTICTLMDCEAISKMCEAISKMCEIIEIETADYQQSIHGSQLDLSIF